MMFPGSGYGSSGTRDSGSSPAGLTLYRQHVLYATTTWKRVRKVFQLPGSGFVAKATATRNTSLARSAQREHQAQSKHDNLI